MSTYIYLQPGNSVKHAELLAYAKNNNLGTYKVLDDSTQLQSALNNAKSGDQVVVYDALSLAPNHSAVLNTLQDALSKSTDIHFAKYNLAFYAKTQSNLKSLIQLSRRIEADFVSERNRHAIEKRQEYGIVLGRPKGRKNRSLKLDKFKKEIVRYLELSISKASIAKLVDCHPQTLYDWIERNELDDSKAETATRSRKAQLDNA
jgi:DNA invertase Pin-like site-specific DNA recombinase